MHKVIVQTLLVAGVLVLSGCASKPRESAANFDFQAKQCVSDVKALTVSPIPRSVGDKPQPMRLDFQAQASCLTARNGNPIPMLVLGLDGKVPSQIDIGIGIEKQIAFAAAVDVLDQDYKRIRKVPFADFLKRGGSYTLTIFLNQSDAAARYLVLRPDAKEVGEADESLVGVRNDTPIFIVAGGALYGGSFATGSEVVTKTWMSEVGKLSVLLTDYAPAVLD
jgi:hypothetical protein